MKIPAQYYQKQLASTQKIIQELKKKSLYFSVARLLVFVLLIGNIAYALSHSVLFFGLLALIPGFLLLLKMHDKIIRRAAFLESKAALFQKELDFLDFKFPKGPNGKVFIDKEHPYARDLIIFGDHSIFHYINRSVFRRPAETLAQIFLNPLKKAEPIKERQKAVQELAKMPDFIHSFFAISDQYTQEPKKGAIQEWLSSKALFLSPLYLLPLVLIPLINLGLLVLLFMDIIPVSLVFSWLGIPLGISGLFAFRINKRHSNLSRFIALLGRYIKIMEQLEKTDFRSPLLQEQLSVLKKAKALQRCQKLKAILNALDSRFNLLAWLLLNAMMVWDIAQTRRLEKWMRANGEALKEWVEIIDKIEAMATLGNFAFNHPDFVYPEPFNNTVLRAKDMGHPLIPAERRVNNDVKMESLHSFYVITGANMSGKTTMLRTIGINLVLASAGLPACAAAMSFKPMDIFTSISTEDSLKDSESYFFAEVKRIKQIIDHLKNGNELYLILDEILKGTNSIDKKEGSKALLKQLLQFRSAGFIATHDLELAEMVADKPAVIVPKRFECEIKDARMQFDYLMIDGVAQNLNALYLMREMGIMV